MVGPKRFGPYENTGYPLLRKKFGAISFQDSQIENVLTRKIGEGGAENARLSPQERNATESKYLNSGEELLNKENHITSSTIIEIDGADR
ncbi:MAG: hypothetical protein ISF22_03095 [Methanomassiliicoccus sp.]|nr:hypothetical protein [Methanomassiliicoccus sp.]